MVRTFESETLGAEGATKSMCVYGGGGMGWINSSSRSPFLTPHPPRLFYPFESPLEEGCLTCRRGRFFVVVGPEGPCFTGRLLEPVRPLFHSCREWAPSRDLDGRASDTNRTRVCKFFLMQNGPYRDQLV